MNRREFLKFAGLALGGAGLGLPLARALGASSGLPAGEAGAAGGRWALAVDLARCLAQEGCRECQAACHEAHNVPAVPEARFEIKWIWKERFAVVFPEEHAPPAAPAGAFLPVLCNHCENPPCVKVCPTGATWRRDDGLVLMDQHRCLGCRYCLVACPYGSRSFNSVDPRRHLQRPWNTEYPTRTWGVVEKCNFCAERLVVGQLPHCVAACPERALTFGGRGAGGELDRALAGRRVLTRKTGLGTQPHVFYLL